MKYSMSSFKTDKFTKPEILNSQLGGDVQRLCSFVKKYQIYSKELWKKFVKQFTFASDEQDNGWRCEYWGKMMRGAASVYSYTHDTELYGILKETVEDIISVVNADGRISSYAGNNEFRGWDMWGRKYVLLGLQYFCEVSSDEELIKKCEASMCKQLDYIIERVGREDGKIRITETSADWLCANSCSILEPVVRLYNRTGKKAYLDFASYIVDVCYGNEGELRIFREALENKLLPHQYCEAKAYETMSCFEGLIEYYRTVGGEEHLEACKNFADRVLENEVSIIGCCGCTHELFDNTRLSQVDPTADGVMQETCVSVTFMKLCDQMLRLTGDVRYADAIERTFFNAFLGSANFTQMDLHYESFADQIEGRKNSVYGVLPFDSYSPLRVGARGQSIGGFKIFTDMTFYGCCACIAPMGIGTYTQTSALISEDGIVINSYLEGGAALDTPMGRIEYKVSSGYPYDGNVKIEIDGEGEFTVTLRIPEWSRTAALSLNGDKTSLKGGYHKIARSWHKGDVIELMLDNRAYAVFPPEDSPYKDRFIAVKKGAIVMALDKRVTSPDQKADLMYDDFGSLVAESVPCDKLPYFNLSMKIKGKDGKELHFIDYASAGSTFNSESAFAAWIRK